MDINRDFLEKTMKEKEINRRKLSEATGLSETSISKIRNGMGSDFDHILDIADALDCPVHLLLVSPISEQLLTSMAKAYQSVKEWNDIYKEMIDLGLDVDIEIETLKGRLKGVRSKLPKYLGSSSAQ